METGLTRNAQWWADKVTLSAQVGAMVGAIIAAGRGLVAAKANLDHGEFERMFRDHAKPVARPVPYSARTGQYLMKIASHPILTKPNHGSVLPPSWRTLAELAKPRYVALIEPAIRRGLIHPDMERKDVRAAMAA